MSYLLAKYTVLFLLATILGFFLGRWWARRRMVDVTESYDDLRFAVRRNDEADWDRLWASLGAIRSIDLAPLDERLHRVERELAGIGERLASIQRSEPEVQDEAAPEQEEAAPAPEEAAPALEEAAPAEQQDEGPRLLDPASYGQKDDLKRISGVGPKLEQLLNENGVYYYWQIASWSDRDIAAMDEQLDVFRGRIARDDWVGQASELREQPDAAPVPEDQP